MIDHFWAIFALIRVIIELFWLWFLPLALWTLSFLLSIRNRGGNEVRRVLWWLLPLALLPVGWVVYFAITYSNSTGALF